MKQPGNDNKKVSCDSTRWVAAGLAAAFVAQVALLGIAGWQNRQILNADEIAYLRIASYYAHGPCNLAVSGYWGPLLSWMMAPFIGLGCPPLDAARIVMGLSAVFFLVSCVALFRCFQLPRWGVLLGTWITALTTVGWSVAQVTPDLLVGGFIALAVSKMVGMDWLENRRGAIVAGAFWGLAYLSKAVAFPLSFGVSAGLAGLWIFSRAGTRQRVFKSLAWTWLACLLVSGPWIALLSVKYHTLTFSTTARIAHTILGPPDVERYHPFAVTFYRPAPGRITAWEDPSLMPYRHWSPLESSAYAWHQVRLIADHATTAILLFKGLDLVGLGLVSLVVALLVPRPWRERLKEDRWRWTVVPVLMLAGVYIPVSAGETRFFYVAFPLLLTTALGAAVAFTEPSSTVRLRRLAAVLIGVCFVGPGLILARPALGGFNDRASACAFDFAARLKAAGVTGPVAGSGLVDGSRTGLYLAYLLNQQWFGDKPAPTGADFKNSNARLVLVRRNQPIAVELEQDKSFRDLDNKLFESAEEAAQHPLKVFENRAAE